MKKDFRTVYDLITVAVSAVLIIITVIGCVSPYSIINLAAKAAQSTKKASSKPFYAFVGSLSSGQPQSTDKTVYAENPLDKLTETPADILQLITAAKQAAASEKEDGKISERKYEASGTSVKIGNISIRNSTESQQNINMLKYYEERPNITIKEKSDPTVLIFHTHTTESYEMLDRGWYAQGYVTRSNSSDRNMVRVGMEIKEQLQQAGYGVIHDTQIHDVKYTGAYDHSRKSVEEYLKKYPTIQIVLDIHRDAIELDSGVRIKPTATILRKKAAQMMIITGCEEGKVTSFPNWEQNLTFALRLQSICEEKYAGLMRPIYFCQRKYNMDLSPNNLLVEMGSCANTLEEAAYSGRLLGTALVTLLNEAKETK